MARKFLVGIDLGGVGELLRALLHKSAGDPSTPVEGQVWYDTVAKRLRFRTDTETIDPTARAAHSGTQTASTISDLAAVVKAYRLDEFAAPTAPVAMGSQRITGVGDPSGAQDAATKAYVDSVAQGLDVKLSVRAVATANVASLSGTTTIDGVSLVATDRVLLTGQTTPAQNGIWVVAAGAWTRPTDFDANAEVTEGAFTFVEEGTANEGTGWVLAELAGSLGSHTTQTWSKFSGASSLVAGAGLTETPTGTFNVGEGVGIDVQADTVGVDTAVVALKAVGALTGGATSEVLTHNLNTRDVAVVIRNNSSPWEEVEVDVEATTVNTVTIRAGANLPAGYRWLVIG